MQEVEEMRDCTSKEIRKVESRGEGIEKGVIFRADSKPEGLSYVVVSSIAPILTGCFFLAFSIAWCYNWAIRFDSEKRILHLFLR
ncbi:MAG: hypothetical protein K8T10_13435 [Candidatus Eremiobacteraeota bacterium]|nr:hypothetical protein [Candidatus Eremiobacteraeota bacterium]